jgi:hypothetical protein
MEAPTAPTDTPASGDTPYDAGFYARQGEQSFRAARVLVPLLVEATGARSVADFGCGRGGWVQAFLEAGVERAIGLDGDWVDPALLYCPPPAFRAVDLTRPQRLEARVDLAISLEVAEHLPDTAAPTFVDSLVAAADIVAFSAAIPGQGGTHHINERWQSYWIGMFADRGYVAVDRLRPLVWQDRRIDPFYRQNILLFATPDRAAALLPDAAEMPVTDVVHPEIFAIHLRARERMAGVPQGGRASIDSIVRGVRGLSQRAGEILRGARNGAGASK